MSMKPEQRTLTDEYMRRDEVAAFIVCYSEAHGGQSPSMQEIADALHISKSAVNVHVTRLIDEGRARRGDGKFWLVQTEVRRAKQHLKVNGR